MKIIFYIYFIQKINYNKYLIIFLYKLKIIYYFINNLNIYNLYFILLILF